MVEDDAQLAHLYCYALGLRNVDCARSIDGLGALRSIEEHRPDPADTRAAILDNDPRKSELLDVMELWAAVISGATEVAEIERAAQAVPKGTDDGPHGVVALRDKLIEVACRGGKGKYAYYICHRRRHHGSSCTNALRVSLADMNEAVLQAIEAHALTPEAIEQVIVLTERDDARDQQFTLTRERKQVEKKIARLVAAVEAAGEVKSLAAKLRELEARRTAIDDELQGLHPLPRLEPRVVEDRLNEWRRLLRGSVTQARAVLQRVLAGRITFTLRGKGYAFEAPTRFDKLFAGVVAPRPAFIERSNVGTEHIGPEDTFDADYGRLLERVCGSVVRYGKGEARPAGLEPATSWFVARRSIQLS